MVSRWIQNDLMYLIPQLTSVAFASKMNATIHNYKTEDWNNERISLTNYIAQYHAGAECMYTLSILLHQDLHNRFNQEFKEQASFLNNTNSIIGFVIAVGVMTNSCIAQASYPSSNGGDTNPQNKLDSVQKLPSA